MDKDIFEKKEINLIEIDFVDIDINDDLSKLPDLPGVYLMRDINDEVIYVGKAKILKNRVRQYFVDNPNHSDRISLMVSKIKRFEYIITKTEMEALILECNLIKKYKPKFNVLLKDDKNYPYIKITMKDEFPRVVFTRKVEKDGSIYFGPYSSVFAVRNTLDLIKKLFPIKICKKNFNDKSNNRPCLNYHIHQCLGPCQGNINSDDYKDMMKSICSFLNGKVDEIISILEKQMIEASENLLFEKAAILRDKINSVRLISQKQRVVSADKSDKDIIIVVKNSIDSLVGIFFIRDGKLIGKEDFFFNNVFDYDENTIVSQFITQYYENSDYIPEELLLNIEIDDKIMIEEWLKFKKNKKVNVNNPKRGEKYDLVMLALQNAQISFENILKKRQAKDFIYGQGVVSFKEVLNMDKIPHRIEAYDISNTGTSDVVGAMIVLEDGYPNNKEYRKFKIKNKSSNPNDYLNMREMVERRFRRAITESNNPKSDNKFSNLPEIILVDGGKGHVNTIKDLLNEMNFNIDVYGMVKDDNHKTRGLIVDNFEIDISNNPSLLRFVTSIQDEVHRYTIEFNRKTGTKRYVKSSLDEIAGIGPKKKKALIQKFGSIKKISEAKLDELKIVEGITEKLALNIIEHFNNK